VARLKMGMASDDVTGSCSRKSSGGAKTRHIIQGSFANQRQIINGKCTKHSLCSTISEINGGLQLTPFNGVICWAIFVEARDLRVTLPHCFDPPVASVASF
jgi:hypothetical protein